MARNERKNERLKFLWRIYLLYDLLQLQTEELLFLLMISETKSIIWS